VTTDISADFLSLNSWENSMSFNNPAVKRTVQVVSLVLLFLVSFVFFLYVTFPYEVLKESLAAEISAASGFSVQISDLGPKFPIGVKAKSVRIEAPSGTATLKFDKLAVGVGIFPLLIGRLSIDTEVESDQGSLNLGVNFGILSLLKGSLVPRHISVNAENFPVDDLSRFGLAVVGSGPNVNPMLGTAVTSIAFTGELNGKADFVLDLTDATQSTGMVELKINNAFLKFADQGLGLDQGFTKALVKARIEGGALQLDKTSGLVSKELEVGLEGKVILKPIPANSQLNMKVAITLNQGLQDQFGVLIDAIIGRSGGDGKFNMQILGSLADPAISMF
jgi:type II secretion system protein N